MKCLNCGLEMETGSVEGIGQGWNARYEFTSDEEKKKKGLKGFLTRKTITVNPHVFEIPAWYCPDCQKVLIWIDGKE